MATIVFHDSRSVLKASDTLVKIHKHVVGTEPISGLPYDANDPAAQLWIHLTAWHSVLYTYEKFGPGRCSQPPRRHRSTSTTPRRCGAAARLRLSPTPARSRASIARPCRTGFLRGEGLDRE
ncbi:oxygenase MpaB family protein [Nocardia sp.]|uniref:oxygenase MpaB family protein n=1 Tax=Nocardia sp. TaxID=1821 RepID=UPI0034516343